MHFILDKLCGMLIMVSMEVDVTRESIVLSGDPEEGTGEVLPADGISVDEAVLNSPLPAGRDAPAVSGPGLQLDAIMVRVARGHSCLDLALGARLRRLTEGDNLMGLGFGSLGDYLREFPGISLRTAQMLIEVDRALEGLDDLRDLVEMGAISILKAHVVLPIATPENQDFIVKLALDNTVRRLREAVRREQAAAKEAAKEAKRQEREEKKRQEEERKARIAAREADVRAYEKDLALRLRAAGIPLAYHLEKLLEEDEPKPADEKKDPAAEEAEQREWERECALELIRVLKANGTPLSPEDERVILGIGQDEGSEAGSDPPFDPMLMDRLKAEGDPLPASWRERTKLTREKAEAAGLRGYFELPDFEPESEGPVVFTGVDLPVTVEAGDAWQHAMNLAQKMVGRDKPLPALVEAICGEYLSHVVSLVPEHVLDWADRRLNGKEDSEPVREAKEARAAREELREVLDVEFRDWDYLPKDCFRVVPPAWAREVPESAYELHAQVMRLQQIRQRLGWSLGRLGYFFRRLGAWRYAGFASLGHYVSERLGMSEATFLERVRLDRRLAFLPDLGEAYRQGVLSFEKTKMLARLWLPSAGWWSGSTSPSGRRAGCWRGRWPRQWTCWRSGRRPGPCRRSTTRQWRP